MGNEGNGFTCCIVANGKLFDIDLYMGIAVGDFPEFLRDSGADGGAMGTASFDGVRIANLEGGCCDDAVRLAPRGVEKFRRVFSGGTGGSVKLGGPPIDFEERPIVCAILGNQVYYSGRRTIIFHNNMSNTTCLHFADLLRDLSYRLKAIQERWYKIV